jgi:hypothetical protein
VLAQMTLFVGKAWVGASQKALLFKAWAGFVEAVAG